MMISVMPGMAPLATKYDAFIVDLWGVVFEGGRAYDGAIDTLRRLKQAGKTVIFLTNSSRRAKIVADGLEKIGIVREFYDGLLSSGEIIHHELKRRISPVFNMLGTRYYYIGPDRETGITQGLKYNRVDDIISADFILNTGLLRPDDDLDTYVEVLQACMRRNLPMVCANPDRRAMRNGRIVLSAGKLAARYEVMGGKVVMRGKPDRNVFDYCVEGLGAIDPKRIAVVGDSFETDLAGAQKAGLDSILVCRGVHAAELGVSGHSVPDKMRIGDMARHFGLFPKAAIPAFMW